MIKILCVIAILASIITIIISVTGQELVTYKSLSIEQFVFKDKTNYVIFIETDGNEKLECQLTKTQKDYLISVLVDKIKELGLKVEKQ